MWDPVRLNTEFTMDTHCACFECDVPWKKKPVFSEGFGNNAEDDHETPRSSSIISGHPIMNNPHLTEVLNPLFAHGNHFQLASAMFTEGLISPDDREYMKNQPDGGARFFRRYLLPSITVSDRRDPRFRLLLSVLRRPRVGFSKVADDLEKMAYEKTNPEFYLRTLLERRDDLLWTESKPSKDDVATSLTFIEAEKDAVLDRLSTCT